MYEEYYGFVQPPFSLTPDPRFLYRSESHDLALQQVWQAIRRKEGFIVLTGDIGTGKTTLCRTLLEQFDRTTFTALILNPFVSVEELLREVLVSYGVASRDVFGTSRLVSASKHELVRTLHDFLLALVPIHGSAVLIVDEAQHLSPDVLEEIRILSNLETNEQKLLQIVLVGQLNLLDTLADAKLRQLDQRISIRCLLKPLNREEVEAYITHRLWVARGSRPPSFTARAFDMVHTVSGGVPRVINLVCDRALMIGCEARSNEIADTLIADAARGLGLSAPSQSRAAQLTGATAPGRRAAVGTLLVMTLLAIAMIAVFVLAGNPFESIESETLPVTARLAADARGIRGVALPAPPAIPLRLTSPPASDGLFAVRVATFTDPYAASAAEAELRSRSLPLYALDMRFASGIRRRLFVGRFATREEAEKLAAELAPRYKEARVVTPASEMWE
jgi:general secretion pathway protein A